MKKMKKLLSNIKDYLPVTRREMKKVITNVVTAMDGFATTSITQIQVTTGLIKEIEKLKADKPKEEKPKEGVRGYQ